MQAVIWNFSAHTFSLLSLGSNGKSLQYLILNVHATPCS